MHPVVSLIWLVATLHSVFSFNLTILHNNDFHSRFGPTTMDGAPCNANKTTCIAGVARTVHMVEKIKSEQENVIFLSAGDFYQGSLWYTEFKEEVINAFVPNMGYDAVCLGNHEFDESAKGLAPFVNQMAAHNIPVLAANLDLSAVPLLKNVSKSTILTVAGTQIGVIGYLTPDTTFLSSPDREVKFLDEITEVRREAQKLKASGINILIALGHSGFAKDIELAKMVEELDIVVGGHSNTFLWGPEMGKPPSIETPLGNYPTVIRHGDRETLVVQAYAYGKFLGKLDVEFDSEGDVKRYGGKPILMDSAIPEDTKNDLASVVRDFEVRIAGKYSEVMGETAVYLQGGEHACRLRECNMGNLVNDAFVYGFLEYGRRSSFTGWTKYPIAITGGGMIRTSFAPAGSQGSITLGDVMSVLPFENQLVILTVSGKVLKSILEHGASAYDPTEQRLEGRFPQVSGIRVSYNMSREIGSRVTSLRVRCSECEFPKYEDVDLDQNYTLITTDFQAQGGDGYDMLKSCQGKCKEEYGFEPVEMMKKYLKEQGIVTTGEEDRITITGSPLVTSTGSQDEALAAASQGTSSKNSISIASAILLLVFSQATVRFVERISLINC